MFDIDLSKIVLFGAVALVAVGPKELPSALRAVGRVLAQWRRVQSDARIAVATFMTDASLDKEIAVLDRSIRVSIAANPATAMRGSLLRAGASFTDLQEKTAALDYASPEMQAYLAPLSEAAPDLEAETAPLPN